MSDKKIRVFKCKRVACCRGSWVVSRGMWSLSIHKTHAAAITEAHRKAAK